MNVLMLGWEFPPYMSGGLGTACQGLTRALGELGAEITFVLPRPVRAEAGLHVRLVSGPRGKTAAATAHETHVAGSVRFRTVQADLNPYGRPSQQAVSVGEAGAMTVRTDFSKGVLALRTAAGTPTDLSASPDTYGGDMFEQLRRYTRSVVEIAAEESFDVIHAHDWMTYEAGIAASHLSAKPLVVHVHSTEFDRAGEGADGRVCAVEHAGIHAADRVIAVSDFTRRLCVQRYAAPAEKVSVVYNAIEPRPAVPAPPRLNRGDPIVLFLGRITMQKGPEYFLAAAKLVLEKIPNAKFIMAGSGDLMHRSVEQAAAMGIGGRVLFAGFLRGADVDRAFRLADVYVMPSVSEPFGIAPLEALANGVPVLISRQAGVSEVLHNALKVDFWDVRDMANKIIAVLRHTPLRRALGENGAHEVRGFRWTDAARACLKVYADSVTGRVDRSGPQQPQPGPGALAAAG
jgi:glycosyltransferase involved in cell wall biosynthesis